MKPIMTIIDNLVEISPKIITREVVRAVIIRSGKILLMYSARDEMYGTPGGGIILNEAKLDTLRRELFEEVGAIQTKILEHLGQVEEFRESRSLYGEPIRILSDYYRVEILAFEKQALEEHEEEMGLVPTWISIDQAIKQNEQKLARLDEPKITFYDTQTKMFRYLKEHLNL